MLIFPTSLLDLIFVFVPEDELFPSGPLLAELTLNFIFNFEPVEISLFPMSEDLELFGDEADNDF